MIREGPRGIRGHWLTIALVLLLAWATAGASAQGLVAQANPGPKEPAAARQQAPAAAAPKPSAQPTPPVSTDQALYLVRSTLLTLNDANRSGNYSVLRDLAAPDFQAKNTAADLAQSFSDLRRRNFDLFAAALLAAQFTAQPVVDANGRLHLTGFFPTRPRRISFDLTFQVVNGQWRLLAISVQTPAAPATQSQLNPKAPPRAAGLFYGFRILSGTAGVRW